MLNETKQAVQNKTRKPRSDRSQIIYLLEVQGQQYVGLTAKTESTVLKSVMSRLAKHWYRSRTENKTWKLCEALRSVESRDQVEVRVLAVIRGKAEGHKEEVRLRRELRPTLNTDRRGD